MTLYGLYGVAMQTWHDSVPCQSCRDIKVTSCILAMRPDEIVVLEEE